MPNKPQSCQVNRGKCEIILCEDATRRDKARLFIELTADGLTDLRRELVERAPDGNELLFPTEL